MDNILLVDVLATACNPEESVENGEHPCLRALGGVSESPGLFKINIFSVKSSSGIPEPRYGDKVRELTCS